MIKIFVENHVVPQLFTAAIEAYEFLHQSKKKVETFGLLWGYSIHAKGNQPAKIVATMATVETSATRHTDWVAPNFDSVRMKKEFFEAYYPNIELIGSFHSHPYDTLEEVKRLKGWRASTGTNADETFFPSFHEKIAPHQENLAHIIVTITQLGKLASTSPSRLEGSEWDKGYIIPAERRKLWLRAYGSEFDSYEGDYIFTEDVTFEIPSFI